MKMKIKIGYRKLIIKYSNNSIINIYDRICENSMGINLNEIRMKYEIKKEDKKLRIFGDEFIKNNINK